MYYYFDGDFPEYEKEVLPKFLYSSIYSIGNYVSKHNQVNVDKSVLDGIKDLTLGKIVNFYNSHEKEFLEFESHQGLNVWFLEHLRLYFFYKNFLCRIEALKSFLKKYPNGTILTRDKRIINYIPKRNVKVVKGKGEKKNKLLIVKRVIHELLYIFSKVRFSGEKKNSDVLIMPKVIGDTVESDFRFGKLTTVYDESSIRILFDFKKPLEKGRSLRRERYDSDQIFLLYLFSFSWIRDFIKFHKSIKKLKSEIKLRCASESSKFIFTTFFSRVSSLYVYKFRFQAYVHYFRKSELKAIVLSDENSPQQKVIQYAARLNGIKIFALQHGAIYYLHLAYTFGEYNTKPLLPDLTFLWGEHYKRVLLEIGGYKVSQLAVVGRVEPLSEKRVDKLNYEGSKRVIVFASQPQPDESLRKRYLQDLFTSIRQVVSKYKLVIRPHPAEKDDAYFNNIGESVGFTDFIIDRQSDLKTHFEKCDVLVTAYSTVGAEFIPYDKPLLILDYLEQDIASYIKEGVGIPIRSKVELEDVLSQEFIEHNKAAYAKFIESFFYKNDGKASERIKKIINEY